MVALHSAANVSKRSTISSSKSMSDKCMSAGQQTTQPELFAFWAAKRRMARLRPCDGDQAGVTRRIAEDKTSAASLFDAGQISSSPHSHCIIEPTESVLAPEPLFAHACKQ